MMRRLMVVAALTGSVCGSAMALDCALSAETAELTMSSSTLDGVEDADDLGIVSVRAGAGGSLILEMENEDGGVSWIALTREGGL